MDWRRKGYNIARMRLQARRVLPRPIFDFADGGAGDERTLRANEGDFSALRLWPRPLQGAASRDLSIELFGKPLSMPLMIGPTGLSGLFWPDGERCSARAAAAAGTAYCQSHASVCTIEDLAGTGVSPRWMQVFIYKDRGFTKEFVDRARAAGHDALVLTTDNQILGNRERDTANGFTIPPRFSPLDTAIMATKVAWLGRMRKVLPVLTMGNYASINEGGTFATLAGRMNELLDPGLSWRDVEWLRGIWDGPFILKGVLHPEEARMAAERGVDGVIASNHGGRQLDGVPSAIAALPHLVEAAQGRLAVLIDGGIRRGGDILKALALGAKCCLIGRPQLWGLAVAGEAGVGHVLGLLRQELDAAMGLCGITRIADIGPELLRPTP